MRRFRGVLAVLLILAVVGCGVLPGTAPSASGLFDDQRVGDLLRAAARGDGAGVEEAIEAGADLHARSNDSDPRRTGITPLHYAVEFQSGQAVVTLLEAGADPLLTTGEEASGYNAPSYALLRQSLRNYETLMEHDPALAEAPYRNGGNQLHGAAHLGHNDILTLLIDIGADLDSTHHVDGSTALHKAAMVNNLDACLLLVRAGADAGIRNVNGTTFLPFLYMADDRVLLPEVKHKRAELVEELEQRGFPVETEIDRDRGE